MTYSSGQKYLAEFVGTMGLLLAVGGAAVFSLGEVDLTRVVMVSLAVGFGLIGLIYAFGDISGGHFNPAVTIGLFAAGRFPGRDVVPYILAQVAGGVLGMGIIAGIAYGNSSLFTLAQHAALGSQTYSGGSAPGTFGVSAVFLFEVAFTFMLVMVILLATRSSNSSKNLAPVGIGLTLLMTNLVGIPIDGASINPARSFAPAVLSSMWSSGNWAIGQDWLFWVAPIIGGLFAALLDRALKTRMP